MTDSGRELIGWVAAIVSFLAYAPYIVEFVGGPTKTHWSTRWMWTKLGPLNLRGATSPHQVSWLIWAILQITIFISSRQQGASATTWIALIYMIGSSVTALFCLKYGERSWKPLDVVCGFLGLVSLVLLVIVHEPLWALILAITTDGIASVPTAVGVTKKPADESRLGWTFFLVGAVINLWAVKTWNFQEAGFTIYLIVVIGYIWVNAFLRTPRSKK